MPVIPPSLWAVLLQAAIPISVDLVNDIVAMIQKAAGGMPLTADDWNALATKWASKQADQYLREAIARSGASGFLP